MVKKLAGIALVSLALYSCSTQYNAPIVNSNRVSVETDRFAGIERRTVLFDIAPQEKQITIGNALFRFMAESGIKPNAKVFVRVEKQPASFNVDNKFYLGFRRKVSPREITNLQVDLANSSQVEAGQPPVVASSTPAPADSSGLMVLGSTIPNAKFNLFSFELTPEEIDQIYASPADFSIRLYSSGQPITYVFDRRQIRTIREALNITRQQEKK